MVRGNETHAGTKVSLLSVPSSDTIYGCQDKEDDIKVGVWSSALFLGDNVWAVCVILDIGFIACLYSAGVANGHGLPYFAISVCGPTIQLFYQLTVLSTNLPSSCWGACILLHDG